MIVLVSRQPQMPVMEDSSQRNENALNDPPFVLLSPTERDLMLGVEFGNISEIIHQYCVVERSHSHGWINLSPGVTILLSTHFTEVSIPCSTFPVRNG